MNLAVFFTLFSVAFFKCLFGRSCPDLTFYCPNSATFDEPACWDESERECEVCHKIFPGIKQKCQDTCHAPGYWNHFNGCGPSSIPVPDFVRKFLSLGFTEACKVHDICYVTPHQTQKACDEEFYKNMVNLCDVVGENYLSTLVCKAAAKIFQKGVEALGGSSFANGQEWSKEHCNKQLTGHELQEHIDYLRAHELELEKEINEELAKYEMDENYQQLLRTYGNFYDKYVENANMNIKNEIINYDMSHVIMTGGVITLVFAGLLYYCYHFKTKQVSVININTEQYGSI